MSALRIIAATLLAAQTAFACGIREHWRTECTSYDSPIIEDGGYAFYTVYLRVFVVASEDATLVGTTYEWAQCTRPVGGDCVSFRIYEGRTELNYRGIRLDVGEDSVLLDPLHSTCNAFGPDMHGSRYLSSDGGDQWFHCIEGESEETLVLRVDELDEEGEVSRLSGTLSNAAGTEVYDLQSERVDHSICIVGTK